MRVFIPAYVRGDGHGGIVHVPSYWRDISGIGQLNKDERRSIAEAANPGTRSEYLEPDGRGGLVTKSSTDDSAARKAFFDDIALVHSIEKLNSENPDPFVKPNMNYPNTPYDPKPRWSPPEWDAQEEDRWYASRDTEDSAIARLTAKVEETVALAKVFIPPYKRLSPEGHTLINVKGYWRNAREERADKVAVGDIIVSPDGLNPKLVIDKSLTNDTFPNEAETPAHRLMNEIDKLKISNAVWLKLEDLNTHKEEERTYHWSAKVPVVGSGPHLANLLKNPIVDAGIGAAVDAGLGIALGETP